MSIHQPAEAPINPDSADAVETDPENSEPDPALPHGSAPARFDAATLLAIIHGVLAGIAGMYVTTDSVTVTVVACVVVVIVTTIAMIGIRRVSSDPVPGKGSPHRDRSNRPG